MITALQEFDNALKINSKDNNALKGKFKSIKGIADEFLKSKNFENAFENYEIALNMVTGGYRYFEWKRFSLKWIVSI